eukprot:365940-Chlamydomonas_euryale.AAC.2
MAARLKPLPPTPCVVHRHPQHVTSITYTSLFQNRAVTSTQHATAKNSSPNHTDASPPGRQRHSHTTPPDPHIAAPPGQQRHSHTSPPSPHSCPTHAQCMHPCTTTTTHTRRTYPHPCPRSTTAPHTRPRPHHHVRERVGVVKARVARRRNHVVQFVGRQAKVRDVLKAPVRVLDVHLPRARHARGWCSVMCCCCTSHVWSHPHDPRSLVVRKTSQFKEPGVS